MNKKFKKMNEKLIFLMCLESVRLARVE